MHAHNIINKEPRLDKINSTLRGCSYLFVSLARLNGIKLVRRQAKFDELDVCNGAFMIYESPKRLRSVIKQTAPTDASKTTGRC